MLEHSKHLPKIIQELIDLIGLPATEAIVRERGGIRLYVPTQVTEGHWLAELIGVECMGKLVEVYRGEEVEIPRCVAAMRATREEAIVNSSESTAELALRYGYTERGIRKIRSKVRSNQDQKTLF